MPDKNKLSRRQLLRSGLAAYGAIAVGGLLGACSGGDSPEPGNPIAAAEPFDGTLRVLGLGLDLTDQVQSYAERDLGFTLEFERSSSPVMIERARSQPDSFDVLSGYTYQVDELWPAAQLISLDRARLESWSSVTDLYKVGRAPGIGCTSGDGDAPFQKLYTARGHEAGGPIVVWGKPDGSGPGDSAEPDGLVGAPSTYNLDSLGYNRAEVGREPEDVSWAELFNETWRGRTALFNDPSFGLQSAALAAEAAGLMSFRDKGNMTVEEIDGLVSILASLKQRGQFRTFWSTFNESVNLMATGEVVVQYMWYPAASFLASAGRPVQYAAPPEGYLGWAGLLMFSKSVLNDPSRLQACYDYANWWHAGIPGALLLSLGYYNAAMSTSEPVVAPAEWAYWIEGEPAPSDLSTAFGEGSIPEGQTRDGGSMQTRSCRIGTWLSFFDEQSEYQRERWGELVAS